MNRGTSQQSQGYNPQPNPRKLSKKSSYDTCFFQPFFCFVFSLLILWSSFDGGPWVRLCMYNVRRFH